MKQGKGWRWNRERRRNKKSARKKSPSPITKHHLTPIRQGGDENGPTILLEESKHGAWHLLVRDSLPDLAADKLSLYIPADTKFFAVNINSSLREIIDRIKKWKDGNSVARNVSKIIQFSPISREHISHKPFLFILPEK